MIAIISAMSEELEAIHGVFEGSSESMIAGIKFFSGRICDTEVVICESGIGKVNASICTSILINEYKVSEIIFVGVAGGINRELDIGDIVISRDLMYHDFDVTAFGHELGKIPRLEEHIFKASEGLVEKALKATKSFVGNHKVITGRILSGDQFVTESNNKGVFDMLGGDCVEMEGAALAHTCYLYKVPFVVIRAISDKADHDASVDFPAFVNESSEMLKNIVVSMLKN